MIKMRGYPIYPRLASPLNEIIRISEISWHKVKNQFHIEKEWEEKKTSLSRVKFIIRDDGKLCRTERKTM